MQGLRNEDNQTSVPAARRLKRFLPGLLSQKQTAEKFLSLISAEKEGTAFALAKAVFLFIIKKRAPIVQRTEWLPSKEQIEVRLLAGVLKFYSASSQLFIL